MFSTTTTKEAATITKDLAANDIKTAAHSVKHDARNKTDNVVDDLSHYADHAGRSVRHFIDSAADTIADSTKEVKERIEKNPVHSSLIALGVGFVLGVLLRR